MDLTKKGIPIYNLEEKKKTPSTFMHRTVVQLLTQSRMLPIHVCTFVSGC